MFVLSCYLPLSVFFFFIYSCHLFLSFTSTKTFTDTLHNFTSLLIIPYFFTFLYHYLSRYLSPFILSFLPIPFRYSYSSYSRKHIYINFLNRQLRIYSFPFFSHILSSVFHFYLTFFIIYLFIHLLFTRLLALILAYLNLFPIQKLLISLPPCFPFSLPSVSMTLP